MEQNHVDQIAARFERKYIPEPNSGCWLWTGALIDGRYPMLYLYGKPSRAHRVSWLIHRGAIPKGMCVLHRCDTPTCVNPNHLFIGTQHDNNLDRTAKGRDTIGERNGRAKLTAEQISQIRNSTETCRVLASQYGICNQQISRIRSKGAWTK